MSLNRYAQTGKKKDFESTQLVSKDCNPRLEARRNCWVIALKMQACFVADFKNYSIIEKSVVNTVLNVVTYKSSTKEKKTMHYGTILAILIKYMFDNYSVRVGIVGLIYIMDFYETFLNNDKSLDRKAIDKIISDLTLPLIEQTLNASQESPDAIFEWNNVCFLYCFLLFCVKIVFIC